MLDEQGIGVEDIHSHVRERQRRFLAALADRGLDPGELLPHQGVGDRGHFLTYRTGRAERLASMLGERGVTVDRRADRLRIGFGIYHDDDDVDRLVDVLGEVMADTTAKEAAR